MFLNDLYVFLCALYICFYPFAFGYPRQRALSPGVHGPGTRENEQKNYQKSTKNQQKNDQEFVQNNCFGGLGGVSVMSF